MFNSLRNRLTIVFVTLAVTPILVISGVLAFRAFSTLQDEAVLSQELVAKNASSDISDFINQRDNQLRMIIDVRRIANLSEDEQFSLLGDLLAYDAAYQEIRLLDATGQELIRQSRVQVFVPSQLESRAEEDEFLIPVDTGNVYFSGIRIDDATREPLITIAYPVIDLRSGETSLVLVADLRFRPIWDFIGTLQLGSENDDIFVTNLDGQLVAHANGSLVLSGTQFDLPNSDGRATGLSGDDVILAREPLKFGDQELVVVAERPVSDAFALATDGLRIALAVTLVTLIIAALLVIGMVRQIVRPIEQLSATALQISSGNLDAEVTVKGRDEIGELAESFKRMTVQLRNIIDNLEHRVADRTRDLEIAFDVSKQITTVLDIDQLLQAVVKSVANRFGLYGVNALQFNEETQTLIESAGANRGGVDLIDRSIDTRVEVALDAEPSLVALAARSRKPIIIEDVVLSEQFLPNPLLPDTRSELSIPMILGDRLIGVFDLQSDQVNRFSEQDVKVLSSLAEQIGIAVENARLYSDQVQVAEELREVNQMKSQFLASMSHELRTPLNSILTFTELMSVGTFGDVTEEQVEYLGKSLSSGRHLLSLINDVLDITKIQSGMMKLFIEDDFDVVKEVEQAAATVEVMLADKPVELILDIDRDFAPLACDKRRIRQVLLNLLSNAIKFTEEGTITLSAKKHKDEILFGVVDNGPGISDEQQAIIFEPFVQTEMGVKHAGGTGLGLPISKQLVQEHGGQLTVESALGNGAAFYFSIPLQLQPKTIQPEVPVG